MIELRIAIPIIIPHLVIELNSEIIMVKPRTNDTEIPVFLCI